MKTNDRIPLELYFHIPFCVRKCAYCDFLSAPADDETKKQYRKSLIEDVRQFPDKDKYQVVSVFIGGGTPTTVPAKDIAKLMSVVREEFSLDENAEITMEANPGTVSMQALRTYREAGINRISFGLQSTKDEELKLLGRIHTFHDFLQSYQLAREAGFENINVDLMFALPAQTLQSYLESLRTVAKLGVEHISAYSLIIEEGTLFYELYEKDRELREQGLNPKVLPSEDVEEQMFYMTSEVLEQFGYEQYEISNYSKPGFCCKHNNGYWTGTAYAGFGLGAASYINNVRYTKTGDLKDYLNGDYLKKDLQVLSPEEQMSEFMILGLRRTEGISRKIFQQRFSMELPKEFETIIEKYEKAGLLLQRGDAVSFTKKGLQLSNRVLAEFT